MNLSGIHHIAIICSNYERSKYFYTKVLGLKIVRETFREARKSYKLDLSFTDGSQIELFSFPNPPSRPSRPEAQGLRHLAFKVPNLDSCVMELNKKNIEVEPIRMDCLWSFMKANWRYINFLTLFSTSKPSDFLIN